MREGVTSIVIPVHGMWPLTEQCLDTLAESTASEIEIIVVDDASPDDTAARLTERDDVVV